MPLSSPNTPNTPNTPNPLNPTNPSTLTPEEVIAFYDAHRTVRQYVTQADGTPTPMPEDHLNAILHAAQRAPTDATAQLYSFIRLVKPTVRQDMAQLTQNAHIATASEAFVICADVRRVKQVLEANAKTPGHWPAIAVHFGIGDAVLAAQNMVNAAEMLGYRACWIGGVLNGLEGIIPLLKLPEGVLPFAALTIGLSAENTPYRPRVPRHMVIHEDHYRDPTHEELLQATQIMNPIADRPGKPGDWAKLLNMYFGQGGGMEDREPRLVRAWKSQGMWPGEAGE